VLVSLIAPERPGASRDLVERIRYPSA
jgi:hypothetical protein